MKRLIVAASVAIIGMAVHAATATWTAGAIYDLNGGDATAVYGFASKNMTQDAFLALYAAGDDSWKSVADTGMSYGYGYYATSVNGFDNGESVSIWGALFDADGNVFITDAATGTMGGSGQDPSLNIDATTAAKKGLFDAAAKNAYSATGSGWYTAVPEPTSGLLLLLGVAGLALRRRRA